MMDMKIYADFPLPFPTTAAFLEELNSTIDDVDEKVQEKTKKEFRCGFRNIIGELIYMQWSLIILIFLLLLLNIPTSHSSVAPAPVH